MEGRFSHEGGQGEEKGLLSRLRLKKEEFLYIIKNGRSRRGNGFAVYVLENKKRGVGISIVKKIKGSVKRHKIMRRMREIYWKNMEKIEEDTKMVIIVREDISHFSYQYLEDAFLSLI